MSPRYLTLNALLQDQDVDSDSSSDDEVSPWRGDMDVDAPIATYGDFGADRVITDSPRGVSDVTSREKCNVTTPGNSNVIRSENSKVTTHGNSTVSTRGNGDVTTRGKSDVPGGKREAPPVATEVVRRPTAAAVSPPVQKEQKPEKINFFAKKLLSPKLSR
jgi:hypothetical protein